MHFIWTVKIEYKSRLVEYLFNSCVQYRKCYFMAVVIILWSAYKSVQAYAWEGLDLSMFVQARQAMTTAVCSVQVLCVCGWVRGAVQCVVTVSLCPTDNRPADKGALGLRGVLPASPSVEFLLCLCPHGLSTPLSHHSFTVTVLYHLRLLSQFVLFLGLLGFCFPNQELFS